MSRRRESWPLLRSTPERAPKGRLGYGFSLALLAAGAALLASAGIALAALFDVLAAPGLGLALIAIAFGFGLAALWLGHALLIAHLGALERLRGMVVTLAVREALPPPADPPPGSGQELARLHAALADLLARRAAAAQAPDSRLEAVLAALAEPILVITQAGQVSLVNHAGKQLLGAEQVRIGTSVYAALERAPLSAALEQAETAGQPQEVELLDVEGRCHGVRLSTLGHHGGAVLVFADGAPALEEHRPELEHDLLLHDRPPQAPPIVPATRLADLPALVLDTETTGLEVESDRIVSIGALRLHGFKPYHALVFDRLVNPGRSIPARSSAVHGITDAMVADAEPFPAVFERLRPLLEGTVLIGHNIAFDVAMLRRACRHAGIDWQPPPCLCTLQLAAGLEPPPADLSLEGLAEWLHVDIHGRHTALGDALVTAEVYLNLLPRLAEAGVTTFGEACSFAARASHPIARQREAGWHDDD